MKYAYSYGLCVIIYCFSYYYKKICLANTFDRLDKLFGTNKKWEKELQIYPISMPKYFIKEGKKDKCLLLISGFRDIPYVWDNFEKYLKQENIDYYAPRTYGKGRTYIQETSYKDWIITYVEAMYILQNIYKEIDIIAFSAGSLIGIYLSQYKWDCKINNLVLAAPFIYKELSFTDKLCNNYWWSPILYNIMNLLVPYKSSSIKQGYITSRNTKNAYYALYDFYEPLLILQQGREILKLLEHMHKNVFNEKKQLQIKQLVTIYPDDDKIIGDPVKQLSLLGNIFSKELTKVCFVEKCGHVIFKENPNVRDGIYKLILKQIC